MTNKNRIALMHILRGDVRCALAKASPFCNPLATHKDVATAMLNYRRYRGLHSSLAAHTFVALGDIA